MATAVTPMLKFLWIELRARLGAILVWGLGIGTYVIIVMALYPSLQDQLAKFDLSGVAFYQIFGDMSQLGTFPGYYKGYVLAFMPLLVGIYAVINGASTLAGEEEDGTLETMIALPLRRGQIVVVKAAALALSLLAILGVLLGLVLLGLLYVNARVDQPVTTGQLWNTVLGLWPVTLVLGWLTLWAGAYLPHRSAALGVGIIALVGGWLLNNLAISNQNLATVSKLTPFHYYSAEIMSQGMAPRDLFILLGAAALLLTLTILSFQRRNITVRAWPWQRARPTSTETGN